MAKAAARNRRHRIADRGSQAVQVLEQVWRMLREIHPSIPRAVIAVVDASGRRSRLGYFAMSNWRVRGETRAHEVAISPVLFGQHRDVLETLLHEAAHASLYEEDGSGGVGSTTYYHTKLFRDRCLAFGLKCEFLNTRYGWTLTSWPNSRSLPSEYHAALALLKSSLPFGTPYRPAPRKNAAELPKSGQTRLSCDCRSVYASRSIAEQGGISCDLCGVSFTAESGLEI